jgi:hypothetical protein
MDHVRFGKRDDLQRCRQVGAVIGWLEVKGDKRDSEALTVHVDGFTGNDSRVRNNVQVARFSAKFRIPLRATADYVFATDAEIGLIVNQGVIGRSTPPGTRYGIGEF